MSSFFLLTNLVLLYHFCSRTQEDLGKKRRDPALRPSLFFSEERKLLKWKWKELAHEIPHDPGGVFPGYFFNLIVGEAIPVELVKEEANLLKFKAVFKNAFAYRISNQQSAFSSFNCPRSPNYLPQTQLFAANWQNYIKHINKIFRIYMQPNSLDKSQF